MPGLATLLAFGALAIVVIVVPGPSNLYVVGRGISEGRRAAAASAIGCATAALLWVLATAIGLAALLASSGPAFEAVHWIGAVYLFALAVRALRGGTQPEAGSEPSEVRLWPAYRQGVLVELGNPKVALFFLALLPQFVVAGHGPAYLQVVVLGALFVAVGVCSDMAYAAASGTIGAWLQRDRTLARRASRFSGLVYLGLGGWVLVGGDARRTNG
jgi:threonine/homoserine/homoserine lactone efflux protein